MLQDICFFLLFFSPFPSCRKTGKPVVDDLIAHGFAKPIKSAKASKRFDNLPLETKIYLSRGRCADEEEEDDDYDNDYVDADLILATLKGN